MSDMKAFEIHTYQSGKWKIDSVFDDRDLAMFEAQRMDSSGRYTGIRVVEDIYLRVYKRDENPHHLPRKQDCGSECGATS